MRCRSHPTRASHLRQPAQGNVIRVCGARANCGPGINTHSSNVAACPASCPHRISRTHYRPSMFNRIRGRAWRAWSHAQHPRDPGESLLSRRQLTLSFFQGFSVLVAVIAVFAAALYRGQPETTARALTFVTLVIANLTLILANRSWSRIIVTTLRGPNPALWWVVGGTIAVLVLSIYVPFLRSLFRFSALDFVDIVICFAAGGASLLWFEVWKLFRKSSGAPQPT
jgi:hypothetical protein